MAKEYIMTEEGKKELEERLAYLEGTARQEASEAIKVARGFGDLSENAEYDAAKNKQAEIEQEIIQIIDKLDHAKVVSTSELNKNEVNIGSLVTVKFKFDGSEEKMQFKVVGTAEAMSADEMKISNESPLGRALIGHKKGEKVTVQAPGGNIVYEIVDTVLKK